MMLRLSTSSELTYWWHGNRMLQSRSPTKPSTHCNKNQDVRILDLLLIVYVLGFVLALELHMLMLVSAHADSFCSCFFPLFLMY